MKNLICVVFLVFWVQALKLSAQEPSGKDSLISVLKTLKDDTIKLEVLDNIIVSCEGEERNKYNDLSGQLSAKLNQDQNKLIRECSYTYYFSYLNDKGFYYFQHGNIDKAIHYFLEALKFSEKTKNTSGIATAYNNLGYIYQQQGEIETAIGNYKKAIEADTNKIRRAGTYNNIGILYFYRNNYDTAMYYYSKALGIAREVRSLSGYANSLSNIGRIYIKQGDYKRALDTAKVLLKLRSIEGNQQNIAFAYENITGILMKQDKLDEAIVYGNKLVALSKELGYPVNIRDAAELMEIIYEKKGNTKEALEMYKLYVDMRDSINNDETKRTAFKKQLQFDSEKKEAELRTEALIEQAKAEDNRKRQNIIIYATVAGMILLAGFLISVFRGLKQQRKANAIITLQKQEVEKQKNVIEEHQKEIIDSIRYARRIQRSLLPTEKYIARKLNNN